MALNLTSAHVKGDEFVKNTKAVIATNQKRVFVFGGTSQSQLEELARKTNKAFNCEASGTSPAEVWLCSMPGSCPSNIPPFTVKLDENEYTLPKEVSTFEMDGKCYLNAMWN